MTQFQTTTCCRNTCRLLLACLTLALLVGCQPNWNNLQTSIKDDVSDLPCNLWEDSKALVTSRENQIVLLVAGAASGGVRCAYDDRVADHFKRSHTFPRDFSIAAGAVPITELGLTGLGYLSSLAADDEQGYQLWRCMIEAQALNGIFTQSLKLIAQDHSPNGERFAWPSGHTSIAVTFATVINEFYGPMIGLPLYGLAGFTAWERMENEEHWASDIIFGVAIGYTVGKTVASKYKPQVFGMDIVPYIDPVNGATGLALMKQF